MSRQIPLFEEESVPTQAVEVTEVDRKTRTKALKKSIAEAKERLFSSSRLSHNATRDLERLIEDSNRELRELKKGPKS